MIALSDRQPYPGLRPFDFGDEKFFFGREAQTHALREKLKISRLIAVVGRSGCGKSSLVRAGLVPLLMAESASEQTANWRIATFRPQGHPFRELADALLRLKDESRRDTIEAAAAEVQALRRSRMDAMLRRNSLGLIDAAQELSPPSTNEMLRRNDAAQELSLPSSAGLLIIVDQFEEIFRFEGASSGDADEATAFVRLLMEAISAASPGIHVLLTMRLDFLGDCARFPRLPEAISDGQFLVPNLSRAERRAAIEEPAKKAEKLIKPEVTQRLLNEVGEDPEQLPVLQHVLMRMWQNASANTEISLKDYEDTGGVTGAISRHADRIYDDLATEKHRKAAERLFKAISERDRRGRSIRRATTFGEIAGIVAGDETKVFAADASKTLDDVIDAFRAPDCCFVMPAADEKLSDTTLIDISHESLLLRWSKLTGNDGWIVEEERNGRVYVGLLEAAENQARLPGKIAIQRLKWWNDAKPNEAWAKRYGDRFTTVERFMRSIANAARARRLATAILAILLMAAGFVFFSLWQQAQIESERAGVAAAGEEQVAQEKIRLAREYRAKLDQALADIQAQKDQLQQLGRDVSQTVQQAQKLVPLSDQKVREDLSNLLKSSTVVSDATAQRAIVDPRVDGPVTLANTTGFLWIGSAQRTNLNSLAGTPVLPNAVKAGEQYLTGLDNYLRQGPPTPDYIQQATVGILPDGTRVQVLGIAPPFSRPTGDQYWAQVRVVSLALSTVYFQFAGGSRDQAQQVSKALQDEGYKIPGEERTRDAKDKHEVRYFYAGQKAVATQLATDTTQALQKLGYPSLSVSAVFAGDPTKSNPHGKPKLWLEIPPR